MKLTELAGKEIINIYDGGRLGQAGEIDLAFDPSSGMVESMILSGRGGYVFGGHRDGSMVIPWSAVRKIGTEVVVVELEPGYHHR